MTERYFYGKKQTQVQTQPVESKREFIVEMGTTKEKSN